MGGRALGLIVALAIGRRFAVEARAIPRGDAGFDMVEFFLRRVGDAVDLVGRADLVGPALGHASPAGGAAGRQSSAHASRQHQQAAGTKKGHGRRARTNYR